VAGETVLLAALEDRFDSGGAIPLQIGRSNFLGRGIDDEVDPAKQIIQTPGQRDTGPAHCLVGLRRRCVYRITLRDGDLDAPIADDVGHADQFHVILCYDGISDAFADDAIPIDGYPNFSIEHFNLLSLLIDSPAYVSIAQSPAASCGRVDARKDIVAGIASRARSLSRDRKPTRYRSLGAGSHSIRSTR
jgi:hypothetical protein